MESTGLNSLRLIYESACVCDVHSLRLYCILFVLLLLRFLKLEDNYLSFESSGKRPGVVNSHCLRKETQKKSHVCINAYVCIKKHA